ncbi:MAG: MCP four helix bundle domain-containing protein [Nitrospirae bacterium]|nr:MCP four helix bundle domain-containing protein [Nitrospirota bacterium]
MRFTLKNKIFFGYAVMMLFTVIVGLYAVWSLRNLNNITNSIVYRDLPAVENLKNMRDNLLAQDSYEKRYLILRDSEVSDVFWNRSYEFEQTLERMASLQPSMATVIEKIKKLHDAYDNIFSKEISLTKAKRYREAENLSEHDLKSTFNKIKMSLNELEFKLFAQRNEKINESNKLGERAFAVASILGLLSLLSGGIFAYFLTNYISSSIESLKVATQSIRSGNYDNVPLIRGMDELAELAVSFKEMSARLKELEAMNLDANPLTKLPGNLAIEKELILRLSEDRKFAFCFADIDYFKSFSDKYGYARGSDVLAWLGRLITDVVKEYGSEGDFVGHIGGDDFVIICSPDNVKTICNNIIEKFDNSAKEFYDPEDAKKGYIISTNRQNEVMEFPIMTISIAVVTNKSEVIRDPKEVAQRLTELKKYAKTFPKSLYVMERRRSS